MAITKLEKAGLSGPKYRRLVVPDPGPVLDTWVRPADWLPLPTVNPGDQKLVGLHAVYSGDSNFVSLSVSGDYTVDWGDGTPSENYAAGVQANHNYTFASVSSATLTTGGYRQAIATITMQGAATFTGLNLNLKHPQGAPGGYAAGWLDLRMAGSSVNALTLCTSSGSVNYNLLQQFEYVGTSALTGFYGFYQCLTLGRVLGTAWTSAMTTFNGMFQSCSSLQTVPLLDTSAGTTFSGMFGSCTSLQAIPLLNTAAGTNFSNMFNGCRSLRTIPLLNTSAGTNFSGMFVGCSSLQTVPLLNTSAGTNFTSMFNNCTLLQIIPLLNTSAGTNFTSMFSNSPSLQIIPLLDTSAGTTFTQMFYTCVSLQAIPLLNTAAGTNFSSMFLNCTSLQRGALNGTSKTIDYSGCRLSAAEIDSVYTNLASGVVGQTINVSGNWGTGSDTPSIATAKGWTVSGS